MIRFAVLFAVCSVMVGRGEAGCKSAEELDECAYKSSFLMNKNLKVPSKMDELQKVCATGKETYNCLHEFNENCVTGMPKQFLGKVFDLVKKHAEERCNDPAKGQELLDAISCLTDDSKLNHIRKCSDKHILLLEKISNMASEKPPLLCCIFYAFKDCMVDNYKAVCDDSKMEDFKNVAMEYSEEMLTTICSSYNTMDKCSKNLPAGDWAEIKPMIEADINGEFKHNYKTAIPIMLKMGEKFLKKSK